MGKGTGRRRGERKKRVVGKREEGMEGEIRREQGRKGGEGR